MMLGVRDLERMQAAFPDHQMELVGGKVIVMSPSDIRSSAVAAAFVALLEPYVRKRRLGIVCGPDGGFILSNGDVRAPDVSYVSYSRLQKIPCAYAKATPELTVEVRSSTDSHREVLKKLQAFLRLGALVGVYVDPHARDVRILREGRADEILGDGDILRVPELFPDWGLAISDLWPLDAPDDLPAS